MTNEKIDYLVETKYSYKHAGLNCAQTVLMVMMEYFDRPDPLWRDIAAPFGGGLCNTHRSVCGAVSGGLMVIGIMEPGNKSAVGKELIDFVREKWSHIYCDIMLGIDFDDEEQVAREKDPKQDTVCTPVKKDICNWLADRYD